MPPKGCFRLGQCKDFEFLRREYSDFVQISPSKSADWTPCYDTNFCARLKVRGHSTKRIIISFNSQVPFDYTNPQGDELAIALLKIPANISTSDPAYRGPILINPGGPGGPGVDLALLLGSLIQTLVGADFDIIGFDPRGECPRPWSIVRNSCSFFIQESAGLHRG